MTTTSLTRDLPRNPDGSLAPLNLGDTIVREIMVAMQTGAWDGRRSCDEIALRHALSRGSVEHYASEAGRFLRIQQSPDALHSWLVTELRHIVEQSVQDRVPAIKLLLDQLERIEQRRGKRPQDSELSPEEARAEMRKALLEPDEDLRALLAECGLALVPAANTEQEGSP